MRPGAEQDPHGPQSTVRDVPQLSALVTVPQARPSRLQNPWFVSAAQLHTLFAAQVWGAVHRPQLAVRETPQTSRPLTCPQFLPWRAQNAGSVSLQLQVLPGPQVAGLVHVPQETVRATPQASAPVTVPQFFWSRAQKAPFVSPQPQAPGVPPPPQLAGWLHAPQSTVRDMPQASIAVSGPQDVLNLAQNAVSCSAAQAQTFAVPPPPQVAGCVQLPQLTVRELPHASFAVSVPQFAVSRVHSAASVSLLQPQEFARPAPPQVAGAAHAPQLTVRWVPQRSVAVSVPQLADSRPQIDASDSGAQPQTPAVQVSLPAQEPQSS